MRDTTEPSVTLLDTLPANATRVEKLATWISQGKHQRVLHWRDYATAMFAAEFNRKPKPTQWSKAMAIAEGM